ncbi:hypothetical protein FACS189490_08270 [Clostridia bacterium]|nr:hypothetical protein FACS189490_08270 [Clostridia bacterium]
MIFRGIQIRFNCGSNEQYENIGRFWDYMTALYPSNRLKGIGHNWNDDALDYAIGSFDEPLDFDMEDIARRYPEAAFVELHLPDADWQIYHCRVEHLARLYAEIYKDGSLDFEIEAFEPDGSCTVSVWRTSAGERQMS